MTKCWLPELVNLEPDNWELTSNCLYYIFKEDLVINKPSFKGVPVNIRKFPYDDNKEEAYYHITCKDYIGDNNRVPDFRRCERIRWVRAFIENWNQCNNCDLSECEGLKIWEEPYKNKIRVNILLKEQKYVVILEKRKNFYLLITAFYLDYEHALKKKLDKFNKYKLEN